MNKIVFIQFLIVFAGIQSVQSQVADSVSGLENHLLIGETDTLYVFDIDPIYFSVPSSIATFNAKELRRRQILIRNVRKAYYYAKVASSKLKEIDLELQQMPSKKDRKVFLEKAEHDLRAQFEDELKKLTITQGRILVKLMDRETGNTTYVLVKEMRGTFSAIFWQSMARLFGSNLKARYDPQGADKEIEEIIQLIDKGLL